jgi:hypothetical protein
MKTYYYIFFVLFFLSGCSAAYVPSSKNVPLFEEKGEVQIEAGASTNSLYAASSYAFSEKYALIANGSLTYSYMAGADIAPGNGGETDIFAFSSTPHRSFEAGIGRYNLLPSFDRRLEVFAGAGYGTTGEGFEDYDEKWQYVSTFVQANIGKRYKRVELGWSLRTAYNFLHAQNGLYRSSEYIIEHENFHNLFVEPLFVLRTGGQHVKFFFRSGLTIGFPLSSPAFYNAAELLILSHLSVGMSYRF